MAFFAAAAFVMATAASAGAQSSGGQGALPALPDVPLYRDNVTANAIDPGPGPASQPRLAWQANIGPSHIVPILVNGLVIVGLNDGHLVALDGYTAAVRWDATLGSSPIGVSLASADGLVYANDGSVLHAVDLATGRGRSAGASAAPAGSS
jgi:outer membrane protein assembly factor BamB